MRVLLALWAASVAAAGAVECSSEDCEAESVQAMSGSPFAIKCDAPSMPQVQLVQTKLQLQRSLLEAKGQQMRRRGGNDVADDADVATVVEAVERLEARVKALDARVRQRTATSGAGEVETQE